MYEEAEVISDPSIPGALPSTWRPIPFVSLTFFLLPGSFQCKRGGKRGRERKLHFYCCVYALTIRKRAATLWTPWNRFGVGGGRSPLISDAACTMTRPCSGTYFLFSFSTVIMLVALMNDGQTHRDTRRVERRTRKTLFVLMSFPTPLTAFFFFFFLKFSYSFWL